jgi:undecaprenyl phosphate-alpha-L-ara4FN deformylase
MTTLGVRVDVDTLRGTREGVPRLLELLGKHAVHATFFFTVGPDNMGRHLWRMAKPRFALKMLRSRATRLYGWEILAAGTCWPGRLIAKEAGSVIREADNAGHEIGLHGWDHHRWQIRAERMSDDKIRREIALGMNELGNTLGWAPKCSAAPGWKCDERLISLKEEFGFEYNSDCRGHAPFTPVLDSRACAPQIPTTLPTYDEVIGRGGTTPQNYNERLLRLIRPDAPNVLTVHAEVEGMAYAALFDSFLSQCRRRSIGLVPLSRLLEGRGSPPCDHVEPGPVTGREGTVAWQSSALR